MKSSEQPARPAAFRQMIRVLTAAVGGPAGPQSVDWSLFIDSTYLIIAALCIYRGQGRTESLFGGFQEQEKSMRSEGATAISQPEGTLDEVPLGDAGSPMNKAPLREVPKPSNNSSLGRTPQPCCVGCFGAPPAPAPPKQRVSVSEEEDEDEAKDGLGGTNHLIRRLLCDWISVYLSMEAPWECLRLFVRCAYDFTAEYIAATCAHYGRAGTPLVVGGHEQQFRHPAAAGPGRECPEPVASVQPVHVRPILRRRGARYT